MLFESVVKAKHGLRIFAFELDGVLGNHGNFRRFALNASFFERLQNGFVGVQSGLMDQFAEACGVAESAMLLDCRSLDWRPVAIPA